MAISKCEIHPAIGIARVGNSAHGVFIGPEVPGDLAAPMSGYKDPHSGHVKRQAARFRVFAYDETGALVGELTAVNASIEWTVEVANAKGEWDQFAGRQGEELALGQRRERRYWRNRDIQDDDRKSLIIAPAPRTLSGPGQRAVFDDGTFLGRAVTLGEIRTDSAGRLLVLGGYGVSTTVEEGRQLTHYANNDRWHDDIADGPVRASITLPDGRTIVATPAWVVSAPPDFSPETVNIVTLYDVALDAAISAGMLPAPTRPSFTDHIFPLLDRALGARWTNMQALRGHTKWADKFDLNVLSNPAKEANEAREFVFKALRNPFLDDAGTIAQANAKFMPALSGDDGDAEDGKPGTWLTITRTQHRLMEQWALGNFDADWTGAPRRYADITPEGLDRAALEACAGGGFYPGIEGGWVYRNPSAYRAPFALDIGKFKAGDLTKRMAVPWQADFFECNTHWWPAQRPDDVLPENVYARLREIEAALADSHLGDEGSDKVVREELVRERHALFARRIPWARGLPDESPAGDNAMVSAWSTLGFVSSTTPAGEPMRSMGEKVYAETQRPYVARLDLAEAFYRLTNIERFPEFRFDAREIALHCFAGADYQAEPNFQPFEYSVDAFRARLNKIYNDFVAQIDDPHWLTDYSKAAVTENLRQKAPMNMTDGAWLHHVLSAGPTDEIRARLFSVWNDEAGNGQTELNHCNVYETLLRSLDVYLPPVNSRAFVELDLLPSAWLNPVFQLSVGLHPEEFFPELLGMTLYLEWEATPTMIPVARMLRGKGIDPQFYAMHAAIDNVTAGHGALAREAVELYLDQVRATGGLPAMQREWRRVWNGYVTWATLGTFGADLGKYIDANFPLEGHSTEARNRMIALVEKKAPYARTAHGNKTLGGVSLGSLFADPERLLDELVARGWVDPESPRDSRLCVELLGFHGPMYKVFSELEMDTLLDWVESLAISTPCGTAAEKVRAILASFAADAALVSDHRAVSLPDGAGGIRTVANWFQSGDLDGLMVAFSDSEFIVKGKPDESKLLTDVFATRMPGVLSSAQVQCFRRWIDEGCPKVGEAPSPAHKLNLRGANLFALEIHTLAAQPFATRRQRIGAGSVH